MYMLWKLLFGLETCELKEFFVFMCPWWWPSLVPPTPSP